VLGETRDFENEQDLLFHQYASNSRVEPPGKGTGLAIQALPPTKGGSKAFEQRIRLALSSKLPVGRPEVLLSIRPKDVRSFFQGFVYEQSHDEPPDIALFRAFYELDSQSELAPVVLAPALGFIEDMESARLSRRVNDLAARMAQVTEPSTLDMPVNVDSAAYGVDTGQYSLREFRDRLTENLLTNRIFYQHESDVGETIESLEQQIDEIVERAEGAVSAQEPDIGGKEITEATPLRESDRYLDPVFYQGHKYDGDALAEEDIIPDDVPLDSDDTFTLTLAIRAHLEGVGRKQKAPAVVLPRRRNKETIQVFARVRSLNEDILVFDEEFQAFDWPFDRDSEIAHFRFRTCCASRRNNVADIEVRLYSSDLHLLELMEIRDVVVGEADESTSVRHKFWPRSRPTQLSATVSKKPVSLALHVMPGDGDGYTMEAIFSKGEQKLKPIPLGRTIQSRDIRNLLVEVRNFWTHLVVGLLGERKSLTKTTYDKLMRELWQFGGRAWEVMFGQGKGQTLGALINKLRLPQNSLIEVSCARGAEQFVFPWSIMRPRGSRKADARSFWGLRYLVEQTNGRGPENLHLSDKPVQIVSLIDAWFAGTVDHAGTLTEVAEAGKWAQVTQVNTKQGLIKSLTKAPPAQLFYFFCHGYTPGDRVGLPADALQLLRDEVGKSEHPEAWRILINRLDRGAHGAKMFFGFGELSNDDLVDEEFFSNPWRPVVFLNMCHSADLLPAMGEGLANRFINSGAAAVVGTECPMTAVFADLFARQVIEELARQNTIGMAVLEARRHFHEERNPLGLAYTLYGRSDARLGSESLSNRQQVKVS
jgi:hypothetical protein